MSIYAHSPEHHIQNKDKSEDPPEMPTLATSGAETTETEEPIAPTAAETESLETPTPATSSAESAESSTPLCGTFAEESSQAATGGTSEHISCPATPPTDASLGKVDLPVGESFFGLVIVTPFLLHFLKRKI